MFALGKFVSWKKGILPKYSLHIYKCQKTFGLATVNHNKTMKDVKIQLIKILQSHASATPESIKAAMKLLPKSQEDIPIRKVKDGLDSAIIPLSKNLRLRERYTMFLGHLRLGRLMEDIDLFAVWCCIKHINRTPVEDKLFPYIIVTIRLDNIEVKNSSHQPLWDVRLSGHVCWVGQSSLEVIVWLDQEINGKWELIMKAFLLMAARNPANTGPAIVNAIQAESAEEKELLEGGERRRQKRQKMMKQSLLKEVPTEEELTLIHNLFKETLDCKEFLLDKKVLPPKSKWMKDATLNNLVFCHPENRNMYNKIFGGFLMRQAFELSWSTAFVHGMRVPKLIHISDIGFYHPVDVGSVLKLYASVNYAENNFIQVSVYSEAFTSSSSEGRSTNSFNFTYDLGTECDSLYPLTYLEAMKYIDGRRHFKNLMEYHKGKEN